MNNPQIVDVCSSQKRDKSTAILGYLECPPLPLVPIIHLISQTAASSKAIAATPALSAHRSLGLSEGKSTKEKGPPKIFNQSSKHDGSSEILGKPIKNTCDVMLMMIFWPFWADSDSLPILDLHKKKSNCWWTETINLWTPICHDATSKPCEMYPKPSTFRSTVLFFSALIWRHWQLPAACFLQPSKSQWKRHQDLTKTGETVSSEATSSKFASCLGQPWSWKIFTMNAAAFKAQAISIPAMLSTLEASHDDMVERTCFSSTTTLFQFPNLPQKTHSLRQITTKLWSIYWWIPTVLCLKNTEEKSKSGSLYSRSGMRKHGIVKQDDSEALSTDCKLWEI